MAEIVLVESLREGCLTGLTAGDLATAKIALVIAPFVPGVGLVLGDLTLATFTGSAPVTVAGWTDPYIDPNGVLRVDGDHNVFICTMGTPDETVYGYALTDATGMDLLASATLDDPVAITGIGDGVRIEPSVPYGA